MQFLGINHNEYVLDTWGLIFLVLPTESFCRVASIALGVLQRVQVLLLCFYEQLGHSRHFGRGLIVESDLIVLLKSSNAVNILIGLLLETRPGLQMPMLKFPVGLLQSLLGTICWLLRYKRH